MLYPNTKIKCHKDARKQIISRTKWIVTNLHDERLFELFFFSIALQFEFICCCYFNEKQRRLNDKTAYKLNKKGPITVSWAKLLTNFILAE